MSLKVIWTSAFVGVFLFSGFEASSTELFRTDDQKATLEAAAEIAQDVSEEFSYRNRIEVDAPSWAKELMFMYRWGALYPANRFGVRPSPSSKEDYKARLRSEFAWILLAGHGARATFDWQHGEQTLAGSTSRLVAALFRSKSFWVEVRNQCVEIDKIRKATGQIAADALTTGPCAERVRRDITISQFVGSNASLFIATGLAANLSQRLYRRFAAKWFAARVLPLIPAFARTKWALAGLTTAVIVIPAGFVVASLSQERETNKVFLEDLQESLKKNTEESDRASVMRAAGLATEREVLELAKWLGENMPKTVGAKTAGPKVIEPTAVDTESQDFLARMRITAPNVLKLQAKYAEVEARRDQLEKELGSIPGISSKLITIAEERKHSKLSDEDAELFRKAQYLASLRLVLKALPKN